MTCALQRRHLLLASLALGMNPASHAQTSAAAAENPIALKLVIVGRRKPGTTLAEHRHHIRRVHGETVLRYIATDPANAPKRYVQNTVFDGQFRAAAPGTDPFALNRDFVTQIFFPDMAGMSRSVQTAFYLQHLKGDEDNFVDQATVVFMPVRERMLHARADAAPAGCKLMGFVQRAAGASPEAFRSAWSTAAFQADPRLRRHAQNDVLPRPGSTAAAAADGIDEFWLDDESSARALLARWHDWVHHALVRPGLAAPGSAFALLMHEDVIHAGAH